MGLPVTSWECGLLPAPTLAPTQATQPHVPRPRVAMAAVLLWVGRAPACQDPGPQGAAPSRRPSPSSSPTSSPKSASC